jgi:hypothetical protein
MGIIERIPSPQFIGRGLNRKYYNWPIFRGGEYNSGGIGIFDQDWDILLILDGCRADLFDNRAPQGWRSSVVESKGSATIEFLRANFAHSDLKDTVYITANPQLSKHHDEIDVSFYSEQNLWSTDAWDDDLGTVRPEGVARAARHANEEYPNKRLLVHFMQPHYPFRNSPFDSGALLADQNEKFFWHKLMTGDLQVGLSDIWDAYADNFDWVLNSIEDLLPDLDGKVVLTSDHGNMIGERAAPVPTVEYGHPPGIYTRQLVEVPWVEFHSKNRRDIQAEESVSSTQIDADIQERLEDLGYR